MNIGNSKKVLMGAAALMIMMFHLWIPVFRYGTVGGQIERFIVAAGYIGVDIFFFVSAYTMTVRPVTDYKRFILNRAVMLLPLFIIALIAGQFLWFIPAIMVTYLAFPPLLKIAEKRPGLSRIIAPIAWMAVTALLLGLVNKNQDLGIYLFRIPIIMLGALAARFDGKFDRVGQLIAGALLTALGILITRDYGYLSKLTVPFKDTFYITAIPLVTGMILLIDVISGWLTRSKAAPARSGGWLTRSKAAPARSANSSANGPAFSWQSDGSPARMPVTAADKTAFVSKHSHRWRFAPLAFLGGISLELYFAQVVFGSWLVNSTLGLTNSRIFTNIVSLAFTIAVSYAIGMIYKFFARNTTRLQNK